MATALFENWLSVLKNLTAVLSFTSRKDHEHVLGINKTIQSGVIIELTAQVQSQVKLSFDN